MRHYGAMFGFIAVSQSRTTQTQSTSGGFLKKKVTTTVKGWVKPEWYVATPVELQQESAQTAAICVSATQTASETTSCDDPAPQSAPIRGFSPRVCKLTGHYLPDNLADHPALQARQRNNERPGPRMRRPP